MPSKLCGVCLRIIPRGNRCDEHTVARPYDSPEYQRERRSILMFATTCWLCGEPGSPNDPDDPLTADHVVPVDHGGGSGPGQLRPAHRSCNSRRGQAQQQARHPRS